MEPSIAVSINGAPIRLTDERWQHIIERHTALVGRRADVLVVIESPDAVYEGKADTFVAVKREHRLYLIAVYKELSATDGFVITSYLARRLGPRKLIWKRY